MTPGPAVFCLSLGVLAYEILLVRLLNIWQWHHFAYMIISLALLGYGASGTFLAITRKRLTRRFSWSFAANAVGFSLCSLLCVGWMQQIRFNPLEIFWDPGQFGTLFKVYLLLALPFFFAANGVGLTYTCYREKIHRVCLADLLGSGIGAALVFGLLFLLPPGDCLRVVSSLGFIAAAILYLDVSHPRSLFVFAGGLACALAWAGAFPAKGLTPRMSEYKALSLALDIPKARIVTQRFSPMGWIALVASPAVPFRSAQGLSLSCDAAVPAQLGIFIDGQGPIPVFPDTKDPQKTAYLDCLLASLPYRLLARPRVLVAGWAGGINALMARRFGAASVDTVEMNRDLIAMMQSASTHASKGVLSPKSVRFHVAPVRNYLGRNPKTYHLIELSELGALSGSMTGAYGLSETYDATVEAFELYLSRLSADGILAVTQTITIPPRQTLKLVATLLTAMQRRKIGDPESRLILVRNWNTAALLVKNGAFTRPELALARRFCERYAFDLALVPGITASEVNRFNVLEKPYFYDGVQALVGGNRNAFLSTYPFDLSPATDDRPYFFQFFKWRSFPGFFSLRGKGGLSLIEWAYPLLIATLIQALVCSLLFILVPLRFMKQPGSTADGLLRWRAALYFFCLGLSFFFVEIALIQKYTLFLGHPVYAFTVTVASFLTFAGIGSSLSPRLALWVATGQGLGRRSAVAATTGLSALLVLGYAFFLPPVLRQLMAAPEGLRLLAALALSAPLALLMGMPFPLGLRLVGRRNGSLISWAWGINGCASVVGAVLATLVAIDFGFTAVLTLASLSYFAASLLLRQEEKPGDFETS
jgi:hypothetical protein